jgi:signal transduction histidine kinase
MKTVKEDVIDIALRGSPILDDSGNVNAVVGIHTDISQRKQAEDTLHETKKLAAMGRMAAGIAHEVNNPLAGIKNAFELVKDAVPEDHEYHSFVERIDAEIERIRRIVHQMYTLYRPNQEEPSLVDFSRLFNDAKLVLEPTAREQRVNLTFEDRTNDTPIRLAEGYTLQVLYNLIRNAIQASPPEGTVHVVAECEDEDVLIHVADQGQGIFPSIRGRIFEPFFSRSTGNESEEMGLGLSVSRALVESMGGNLRFDTEVGEGTTFIVQLPQEPPLNP